MKLRIKKVNEETRTVSGFTEFTHNGKDSLMENGNNDKQLFYSGKDLIKFLQYKKGFKELCNLIKEKNITSIYKSLIEFKNEHNIFLTSDNEKNLTPIIITKTNDKKEDVILAICAFTKSKKSDDVAHILLSNLDYKGGNSKEIYNYIIDVICEKKLSKIKDIVILGIKSLENAGYYSKYEKIKDNNISVLIYKYSNPYYKEEYTTSTNNKKEAFNRNDKEKYDDDISKDKSLLTDKKDKKQQVKPKDDNGIIKVIGRGISQGVNGANSNKYMVNTMYNAYDNEKKNNAKYMY